MQPAEETQPIQSAQAAASAAAVAPPVEAPKALERAKRRHRHHSRGPKWLRPARRVMRKLKWANLIVVAIGLVLVLVVTALVLVTDTTGRVQSSMTSLARVADSLRNRPGTDLTLTDFNRLQSSVAELGQSLATARSRLGLAAPLRAFNSDLAATTVLVEAAADVTGAAQEMLNALQPTLFFLVAGDDRESVTVQISSGERIVELLGLGRGLFLSADERLASAQARLDSIDLGQLSPSLLLNLEGLRSYQQQLVQINAVLKQAPELLTAALGLAGEQSYLILSQNSDELRPSGGYISTYGWLVVRNGRIIDYSYSPTTATSPNPPAARFADDVIVPDWWFQYREPLYAAWDGSWHADFPETAKMAMWFYNTGGNPRSPVSGVIAIDILGFEAILEALDEVVVPGFEQVLTLDTFRQIIYDIRAEGARSGEHKQFLATIYQQIFNDWQTRSADPDANARLLGAMLKALQEKHIMIYSASSDLNQAIDLLGWSGRQNAGADRDYLMVVDANMGNKSNRSIIRQVTYDVDIQNDGRLMSRAAVSYDYSARIAALDPAVNGDVHGPLDYFNLMQIFVPLGSELTGIDNLTTDPDIVTNEGHTSFVARVEVPYDSSERFQFIYRTPPLVQNFGPYQRYRLLVQKQAGTPANAANVQVTLPQGAAVISVIPEAAASYTLERPIVEFLLQLDQDRSVEIIYQTSR